MMPKWCALVILSLLGHLCIAYPLDRTDDVLSGSSGETGSQWKIVGLALLTLTMTAGLVYSVWMCTCCGDELLSSRINDTRSNVGGFDPPNISTPGTPRGDEMDRTITIEPLPDLPGNAARSPAKGGKPKPMGYNQAVNRGLTTDDWFSPGKVSLPRGQLSYNQELGAGWFGHVVDGTLSRSSPGGRKVKAVVKIASDDLSALEKSQFLLESKVYRDVNHPNVLKILGTCLDSDPYLIVFEHTQGDLKAYLLAATRQGQSDSLIDNGLILKFCCDVAAGLAAIHDQGMVVNDLAGRTCVVLSDNVVKIGDYGTSVERYKDDYLIVGDTAVPVRWCAPESLDLSSGRIVPLEVTKQANVWTLGVLLWEILEFGKLPYMDMNTTAVVESVLKGSVRLRCPVTRVPHIDRLYETMQFCWLPAAVRLSATDVLAMVKYVYEDRKAVDSADFDRRWNNLLPNRTEMRQVTISPVPPDPKASKIVVEPPITSSTISLQTAAVPLAAHMDTNVPAGVTRSALVAEDLAEKERSEKRQFVLSLSDEDLANLRSDELVQFYEFLSKNEIFQLEAKQQAAQDKAEKRRIFYAMGVEQMGSLSSEELEDYLKCMSDEEQSATKKRYEHQQHLIQVERQRVRVLEEAEKERLRKAEEEETSRLKKLEEEKLLAEAMEKRRLEDQLEQKRAEDERLAREEAERKEFEAKEKMRLAAEEEEKIRLVQETERKRLEAELLELAAAEAAERDRLENLEKLRAAEEAERRRIEEEKRLVEEESERRRLQEEEELKLAAEEENRKRLEAAQLAEQKRLDEEEAERKRLETAERLRLAAAEEERKRLEDEEKLQAAQEAERKRLEDEDRLIKEETERKRQQVEEEEKLRVAQEAEQKQLEEEELRAEQIRLADQHRREAEQKKLEEERAELLKAEAVAKQKALEEAALQAAEELVLAEQTVLETRKATEDAERHLVEEENQAALKPFVVVETPEHNVGWSHDRLQRAVGNELQTTSTPKSPPDDDNIFGDDTAAVTNFLPPIPHPRVSQLKRKGSESLAKLSFSPEAEFTEADVFGTPESRVADYDLVRKSVLKMNDEDLKRISLRDFETLYQYLSPSETFEMREKVDRLKSASRQLSTDEISYWRKRPLAELQSGSFSRSFLSSVGSTEDFLAKLTKEDDVNRHAVFKKSDDDLLALNPDDLEKQMESMSTEEIRQIRSKIEAVKQEKRELLLQSTAAQLKEMPKDKFDFYSRTCLQPDDREYLHTIILGAADSRRLQELISSATEQQAEYKKFLATTAVSLPSDDGSLNFNSPMNWEDSPAAWGVETKIDHQMKEADRIKQHLVLEQQPDPFGDFRLDSTADSLKVNVWDDQTFGSEAANDPWAAMDSAVQPADPFTPGNVHLLDFDTLSADASPASALYTSASEPPAHDSSKASDFDLFSTPTAAEKQSNLDLLVDFGTPVDVSPIPKIEPIVHSTEMHKSSPTGDSTTEGKSSSADVSTDSLI